MKPPKTSLNADSNEFMPRQLATPMGTPTNMQRKALADMLTNERIGQLERELNLLRRISQEPLDNSAVNAGDIAEVTMLPPGMTMPTPLSLEKKQRVGRSPKNTKKDHYY